MPMPKPLASSSSPSARVQSPFPSASMTTSSPTFAALPQAPMTNTSLTARQAMVSTPLALIRAASCTNPGRCLALHVGVKAPGTENSTTFLPLKSSSVVALTGPSLPIRFNVPLGTRSPTLIVMHFSIWCVARRMGGRPHPRGEQCSEWTLRALPSGRRVGCGKAARLEEHAGHRAAKARLQPAGGRDQGVQLEAGAKAATLEQIDEVLGGNVAGRGRRERTAADPADTRIQRLDT